MKEPPPMPSGETSGVEVLRLLTDETRWRLLLALPLLRRTGRLARQGLGLPGPLLVPPTPGRDQLGHAIDDSAPAAIVGLGAADFV